MITVTIMNIYIYIYKSRAGIFKSISGNIPDVLEREYSRRSLIGGNFPDGSFPDTEENLCEDFSSVRALALIFIRKIFIL